MKTLLITCLSVAFTTIGNRLPRFGSLDLTSPDFDITWADITDDLWP